MTDIHAPQRDERQAAGRRTDQIVGRAAEVDRIRALLTAPADASGRPDRESG